MQNMFAVLKENSNEAIIYSLSIIN
jgi:hypothetical protein